MERPKRRSRRWGLVKDKFRFLKNASHTVADTTQALAVPLQELSDAFPPLRGVASSVLAISRLSQRVKRSKKEARSLVHDAYDVLDRLCSAIDMQRPVDLPIHLREEIRKFEQLVQEMSEAFEQLSSSKALVLFVRLDRNEDRLVKLRDKLNNMCRGFTMGSLARLQAVSVADLNLHVQITVVQHADSQGLKKEFIALGVLFC